MMKLQIRNLFHSIQFAHVLMAQLRWSKNITEEREAPQQFIVGAMEERICPLLSLAVYAEILGFSMSDRQQARSDDFLFSIDGEGHRKVREALERIFSM